MQTLSGPYTSDADFSGLAQLKSAATQANVSPEVRHKIAEQFESIFLQMMLKSMRQASDIDTSSFLDNNETEFYQKMFDQKIATYLSGENRFGLADMIYRQLGAVPSVVPGSQPSEIQRPLLPQPMVIPRNAAPILRQEMATKSLLNTTLALPESTKPSSEHHGEPAWKDPESFARYLYPIATEAVKGTRIKPEAVLSVAALETGWGQHMMQDENGHGSFNLFGIKATVGWNGKRVASPTLEYENGIVSKKTQVFRAYADPAESCKDFVTFLQQNPRYQFALEQAANPEEFARELKKAGYATDPAYDKKIISVMNSPRMQNSVSALQENKIGPLL